MTPDEKKALGMALLRGVVLLLVFAAVAALYVFLFTEMRPRAHDVDILEAALWGVLLKSTAFFVWRKIFPKEEEAEEELRSFVMALLSLLTLYAFRHFKNGSPFIDTEGLWESLGLMILFILVGSFVVDWLLPKRDKES